MKTKDSSIFIFAGAGISQESGLSTFRDNGGLWEKYDVMKICNFTKFLKDINSDDGGREDMFEFYNMRKHEIFKARPNDAHFKIAEWQSKYGEDRVHVVTSNIDDLFEKAGVKNVTHVHGETSHMMCAACDHRWFIGDDDFDPTAECPECGSCVTKPNVVFFGEGAPEYRTMADRFSPERRKDSDLLFYVGSSMSVVPPNRVFYSMYGKNPGFKFLVDLNAHELSQQVPMFDFVIEDTAVNAFNGFKF